MFTTYLYVYVSINTLVYIRVRDGRKVQINTYRMYIYMQHLIYIIFSGYIKYYVKIKVDCPFKILISLKNYPTLLV